MMSPMALDEKVRRFCEMVGAAERVGVSEFARSKSWREKLPAVGCFEVVDRGGVVGYMLAPDFAAALNEKLAQLEEQVEKSQIAAMFKARENYSDIRTGETLKAGALSYFDDNADALVAIADAD